MTPEPNVQRSPSKVVWFVLASLWIGVLTVLAARLDGQAAPQVPLSKLRIELADSARRAPKPADPGIAAGFRRDFVRTQTALGMVIYAPAFAATVAKDDLAWAASYLLVAGGSFIAAAEISRQVTISDPMHRLATGAPVRGAVAGAILAELLDADRQGTAGAILFSSMGATTAGLLAGRKMNDGEAAATLFVSDVLALGAYGAATAAGVGRAADGSDRMRLSLTLGGMIAGAPLGHAYAALAPYHVTRGDLTAMTAASGVGMLAGLSAIAGGDRTDRQVAAALTIGGAAGLLVGERLLAERYDHTESQGRMLILGGVAGGLMGGGVALLARGDETRLNALSGALITAGAAAGIMVTQRYLLPTADGAMRLGSLKLSPMGLVAAATGMRGAYTLGSLSFEIPRHLSQVP